MSTYWLVFNAIRKVNHKIAFRIPGSTKITQQEVPLLFSFSSFLVSIQMST